MPATSRKASIARRMSVVQQQVVSLREADGDATDVALLRFSTQHLEDSKEGYALFCVLMKILIFFFSIFFF
jgi:hypothetical protein